MFRVSYRPQAGRFRLRWLACSLGVAGWSLLGLGCTPWGGAWYLDNKEATIPSRPVSSIDRAIPPKAPQPTGLPQASSGIQQISAQVPASAQADPAPPGTLVLPQASGSRPASAPGTLVFPQAAGSRPAPAPGILVLPGSPGPQARPLVSDQPPLPRQVPIDLDAVLHLAEQSNLKIGLAREKLHESELKGQASLGAWMPQTYAGMAYYRHEGGIQDFTGRLIHSSTGALSPGLDLHSELDLKTATYNRLTQERELWEQKANLSKVSDENLLDAASTYIDLLTARRGEAVGLDLERYLLELLPRAENLASENKAFTVLVESLRGEISRRRQAMAQLHQQGDAASVKLAYLLGLDPCTLLVPMDLTLIPVELVDCSEPVHQVVARVMAHGPGIKELQGLVSVAQEGVDKMNSPLRYMPILQMNMYEGAFGAGPGATLAWDNRFDLGLQARWNLNDWLTARERKRVAESQLAQAHLSYKDLQAQLTVSVQESREAIVAGRQQIIHGAEMIKYAAEAYRLCDERMKSNLPDSTPREMAQNIRALEEAHFKYIGALNAHNKAQIRLMLLQGPPCARPAPPPLAQK